MVDVVDVVDVAIEGTTSVVFAGCLVVLLIFSRKIHKPGMCGGWKFIKAGFVCLLFGMVMDTLDEFSLFTSIHLFGIPFPEFAEEILGHMLGGILLTIGFIKLTPTEIARLAAEGQLRQTNLELDAKVKELNQANTLLNEEIVRREKTEIQLKDAKERAEQANTAKSRFLAAMSHDIRTPLNAVLGMTEMLKSTSLTEEQGQYVQVCRRSGQMLLSLINDILDLSKFESHQLALDCTTFNVERLISDTCEMFYASAQDKHIVLDCITQPSLSPWRLGDPRRLQQILVNLIGNALKFTKKGKITVSLESMDSDHLRFLIEDTGVGIPEEYYDTIFQPYTQIRTESSEIIHGTGLGLQICKDLTVLMEGDISVKSKVGAGTTFSFTAKLPIIDASLDTEQSAIDSTSIDTESSQTDSLDILYADDAFENRVLMGAYLKKTQHNLVLARDGNEALSIYKKQRFDLILLDLEMPEMDGFETIQSIREIESKHGDHRMTIVAVSAHAMKEIREKSLAFGFDDYLTKPLSRSELLLFLEHQRKRPN